MSRSQKPRRPEFFPCMRYRAGRRTRITVRVREGNFDRTIWSGRLQDLRKRQSGYRAGAALEVPA